MARSSRSGSFDETGCGMAPIFQQAAHATNQSTELGRATVTMSPTPTPPAARSRARRFADNSSSSLVKVSSPQLIAGRFGSLSASFVRRWL